MTPLRILVACEFSGLVRDAFNALGHNAVSCDLEPSERPGPHVQGDVRLLLGRGWDLMIAHPPCTYLAVSGARWKYEKPGWEYHQRQAVAFVQELASAPIKCKCIENPISILSTQWRKPSQIVQPWQFGHGETKATCLWLEGLPKLIPSKIVEGRKPRVHHMPPGPERQKARSRTYPGIAVAMACQWSAFLQGKAIAERFFHDL